jgi:hypothetical protein
MIHLYLVSLRIYKIFLKMWIKWCMIDVFERKQKCMSTIVIQLRLSVKLTFGMRQLII